VPDASWRCRMDLGSGRGHRAGSVQTLPWGGVFQPGLGPGPGPHQTTGKRMVPQQMRSTRKRISFQSL
jgi:hypothetical protein